MTSPYYLAGEGGLATLPADSRPQIPTLVLESMDGSVRIPLDGTEGFIRMPGSTGLEMPPSALISQSVPGIAGTRLADVRVMERPIFIPIYAGADGNMLAFREMLRRLHRLIDPMNLNSFRLVGGSAEGTRELIVTYSSGLEGADAASEAGLSWAKFGLNLVAHRPYAQARETQVLEFRYQPDLAPFLGVAGGSDTPWPRSLASTSIIGNGMEIVVDTEMPVYPEVELVGPMDSFSSTLSPIVVNSAGQQTTILDQQWVLSIPGGVPAGSTFRANTDPSSRSFRLNGELAAGRVALGSRMRPFYPGRNTLNVTAPGLTEATVIRISWLPLYRSLW